MVPPWRTRLDALGFDSATKIKALRLVLLKPEADRELWVDQDLATARDLITADIAGKILLSHSVRSTGAIGVLLA
jgi:hypothetical protein